MEVYDVKQIVIKVGYHTRFLEFTEEKLVDSRRRGRAFVLRSREDVAERAGKYEGRRRVKKRDMPGERKEQKEEKRAANISVGKVNEHSNEANYRILQSSPFTCISAFYITWCKLPPPTMLLHKGTSLSIWCTRICQHK